MTKEDLMRRAIELSRRKMIEEGAAPFAALIVRDGEIVGEGYNRVLQDHDATAHGEVEAIRDAGRRLKTFDLSGCELYTSCEPCPLCVSAMFYAGIEKLYYAATLSDSRAIGAYPNNHRLHSEVALPVDKRTMPSERVLNEEARAVLDEWKQRPDFSKHF